MSDTEGYPAVSAGQGRSAGRDTQCPEQKGLALQQVDRIYIAGVFGLHISKKSAVITGLFPGILPRKSL